MKEPLVSVIMAAYNAERYIKKSILSVLDQTYKNLQLIVINDGSTDDTLKILDSISDKRIEVYSLEENRHIAYATNVGFSKVRGEYVAIIDSDDVWFPDKLEKQVRYLTQHPEHQGCFTWVTLIDENDTIINDKLPELYQLFAAKNEPREAWLRFFFFHGNRLNNPSSLITYRSFAEIGPHNLFYIQAMDFEYWVRFTKKFSFGILEEPLVYYRRVADPQVNISSYSEVHDTRFYNEYNLIRYHFFDDMDAELFVRTFREFFVCQDSRSREELLCEQAFLLCRPLQDSSVPSPFGMLKLEKLMSDQRIAVLLKQKYGFSTIECGTYTGKHVLNDLYTQKYPDKITGLEHWLDLTRQHIQKQEGDLTRQQEEIAGKEAAIQAMEEEMKALKSRLSQQEAEIRRLDRDLQIITNSSSWKITAPLRALKDKISHTDQ